jgi:hypothetical protein
MFFDLGVFLAVIGGTMLALATIGRLGQRRADGMDALPKAGPA